MLKLSVLSTLETFIYIDSHREDDHASWKER